MDLAGQFAVYHGIRSVGTVVCTQELIPAGLKAVDRSIYGKHGIVVAAFTVLCLVIDCGAFNLLLAGAQITLEILHIVIGIPKTPFYIGKERNLLFFSAVIL